MIPHPSMSQEPRGARGLVRTRNRVVKHDGTVALVHTPLRMIKCGEGAAR